MRNSLLSSMGKVSGALSRGDLGGRENEGDGGVGLGRGLVPGLLTGDSCCGFSPPVPPPREDDLLLLIFSESIDVIDVIDNIYVALHPEKGEEPNTPTNDMNMFGRQPDRTSTN